MDYRQPITLKNLYPDFSDEQLGKAEANLERFLTVLLRFSERLTSEGSTLPLPDLTASESGASIPAAKVESTPH